MSLCFKIIIRHFLMIFFCCLPIQIFSTEKNKYKLHKIKKRLLKAQEYNEREMCLSSRLKNYYSLNDSLLLLSDQSLLDLIEQNEVFIRQYIGLVSKSKIYDIPVCIKKIPLTDKDLSLENFFSTKNYYQISRNWYAPWRELKINQIVTESVLSKKWTSFVLLYHYRIIYDQPLPISSVYDTEEKRNLILSGEFGKNANAATLFDDLISHKAYLLMIFEYFPNTLLECTLPKETFDLEMKNIWRALNALQIFHWDYQPHNILTDGKRLYCIDFSVSLHPSFELNILESHIMQELVARFAFV